MNIETRAPDSSNFDDYVIRRFLLGELDAQQRTAFEAGLLTNDELETRVRLHEVSIVDDYLSGSLSRAHTDRFRRRFLVTRDRHRMVRVAQALRDRFSPAKAAELHVFNLRRAGVRYAFAALLLLIVFATVWLGVKERRLAIKLPIPKRVQPKASATQSPVAAHHPTSSSVPTHSEDVSSLPDHETVLSITLATSDTVENPYELKFVNRDAPIRAVVSLMKNESGSYRAELWNSRGESMFSAAGLTPSDEGKLTVEIPALDLAPGEYMVLLKDTADAPGLRYYLRIVR